MKFVRRYPGMCLTRLPVGQSGGPGEQIIRPRRMNIVVIDDLNLDSGNLSDSLEIFEEDSDGFWFVRP